MTSKKRSTKKRTLSPAQKAALAKGRKALTAKRGGTKKISGSKKIKIRKVPEHLEPIIIKGGSMAKRKTRRKAAKRYSGLPVAGAKRRTSKKARRYHGGTVRKARRYNGASSKLDIIGLATDIVGVGLGAVGGSFIAQKVPVKNAKIKALIPIAIGLGLGMTKYGRGRIAKSAAGGMIAVGTLSLVKQFFPTIPLLTGAEDAEGVAGAIAALPDEERALLGYVMEGESASDELVGVQDAPLSPDSY